MAELEVFEEKARKGFRFFDLNKDGYLTKEEMLESADRVCSLSDVTGKEAEKTREEWAKWCDLLLPDGQITENEFVIRNKRLLAADPETYKREDESTYGDIFEKVDANKDGFISQEELRLYYKAFGYGDDYDIDQIFRRMDNNNDGLISRDEFVTASVTYWSNEPGYDYLFDVPRK